MYVRRILFADNDPEFLTARSEILERAGYQVTAASSLAQAEEALTDYWFHLAILDVRLIDDFDERDLSGLRLAKQEAHSCIPKIILTKFPEHIREMLDGLSPILEFVAKADDSRVLLRSMDNAFEHRLRINSDLIIQFNPHNSTNFLHLASLIDTNLRNELVLDRAKELEDLFRKIFYENSKIRIDRLLWQHPGRIALIVIAFKEHNKPETFLVVCGPKEIIRSDLIHYKEYSPKAHGANGTVLVETPETIHYAASNFALTSDNLENFQTLHELYRFGSEKLLQDSLASLFQVTLHSWHQGRSIPSDGQSLNDIYLDRLKLSSDMLTAAFFNERIKYMEHHLPSLGVRLTREGGKISVQYSEKTFTFPDPFDIIPRLISRDDSVQLVTISGNLSGGDVIADESGRSWLTDFSEAGLAPLLWSYTSLESAIRFDWVDANYIRDRHEMENCLNHSEYDRFNVRDLEPSVRKPARAIQMIRKLAAQAVGSDMVSYHRGILFHALRRSADFDIYAPVTSSDLARIAHIFISIAMLTALLADGNQVKQKRPSEGYPELRIDPSMNMVLLGEKHYRLSPRPFKLVQYLYDHADRVCTTDELRKNVIGENYNPTYIHTLIGRIREVIESDPNNAAYLITEPNIGYMLIRKP
ncbi:MAG: winged helix-turn-helix domain-containing protein [Chloroflexi bacterium]|nr:winged helix-turn-helix domain-containing protein [Chloroflexota bacterium]